VDASGFAAASAPGPQVIVQGLPALLMTHASAGETLAASAIAIAAGPAEASNNAASRLFPFSVDVFSAFPGSFDVELSI
jgi:hypothetical protein